MLPKGFKTVLLGEFRQPRSGRSEDPVPAHKARPKGRVSRARLNGSVGRPRTPELPIAQQPQLLLLTVRNIKRRYWVPLGVRNAGLGAHRESRAASGKACWTNRLVSVF